MAPILGKIAWWVRDEAGAGVDVKLPSFVDDMCMDIADWEGDDGQHATR